ncbi:hypothetical protein HOE37_02825 [Candidatus Woesearchaeota archaeon]|jgi:hypothetical protein|nr:hypothetical protein [Candidatus Woesearchaeota archaeon]MBT4336727.1 hypothetical protein [Candidatus Woesearchaeota archaeon]MBT4469524.1 hypothetical protein [Candidatus Woesearchaeota archaeon]MBT6743886.1 hypothetical protein [Candidatus Woesearchaeota archaeon]
MGGLVRKAVGAMGSLMFLATVAWAVEYVPKYLEEPQPIPQSVLKIEFIGPNYCTPGLEADEYKIGIENTVYRLLIKYDLEVSDIEKYNSKLKDITSITTGGTLCLPPGTLEEKL